PLRSLLSTLSLLDALPISLFRFSLSAMILCAHLLYKLVLNYSTHNTILPIFLLFSIYLWASCTCSNGNVLSSTGFNQPVLKRFQDRKSTRLNSSHVSNSYA